MEGKDQIYLTGQQIEALHLAIQLKTARYGRVCYGVEVRGDDSDRTAITGVALMGDGDNSFITIDPDGSSTGWVR